MLRPESPHAMPRTLGPMPTGRRMRTADEGDARAAVAIAFDVVRDVERWPQHLPHYRAVRILDGDAHAGGIVEMAANRPFGPLDWPTWWRAEMAIDHARPAIRFRHVAGVTTGMEVEWAFSDAPEGTHLTLVHEWDGPAWPLIGQLAAVAVIGPVFVQGIAARTMSGLVRAAESRSA